MKKEFTRRLRERSCDPNEYTKNVNVEDFVKYDRDCLWRTTNDMKKEVMMNQQDLKQI